MASKNTHVNHGRHSLHFLPYVETSALTATCFSEEESLVSPKSLSKKFKLWCWKRGIKRGKKNSFTSLKSLHHQMTETHLYQRLRNNGILYQSPPYNSWGLVWEKWDQRKSCFPSEWQKSLSFSGVSLHSQYLASVSETHCSHLGRNRSHCSLLDPQRGRFYYSPIAVMDGSLTPSWRKRGTKRERLRTQSGRANVWPR